MPAHKKFGGRACPAHAIRGFPHPHREPYKHLFLLVVEELVLQHLVVGHGLPELVDTLEEELANLGDGFDLELVHHITHIKHSTAVIEILSEWGAALVVSVNAMWSVLVTGEHHHGGQCINLPKF